MKAIAAFPGRREVRLIEQEEIGRGRLGQADGLGAGARRDDLQPVSLQVGAEQLPDLRLVLDQQDRRAHRWPPGATLRSLTGEASRYEADKDAVKKV